MKISFAFSSSFQAEEKSRREWIFICLLWNKRIGYIHWWNTNLLGLLLDGWLEQDAIPINFTCITDVSVGYTDPCHLSACAAVTYIGAGSLDSYFYITASHICSSPDRSVGLSVDHETSLTTCQTISDGTPPPNICYREIWNLLI